MSGHRVDKLDEIIPTMKKAQKQEGPTLIEFVVEQNDMVYPMVPAGADLHDMITRPDPSFMGNGEKREKERIK